MNTNTNTNPTPWDLTRCELCNGGTSPLVSWAAEEITPEQVAALPAEAGGVVMFVVNVQPDGTREVVDLNAFCRSCLADADEPDAEEDQEERTEPVDHESTWYAMRVGRSIRPTNPTASEFFDEALTLLVFDVAGTGERRDLRALTTYGTPDIIAGDTIKVVSSAPSARPIGRMGWNGRARVVAVRYAGGEKVSGVLPTHAVSHLVAK